MAHGRERRGRRGAPLTLGMEIGLVHLVWPPLGLEPFRRFVAAYRRNPGGVAHRLVVLFNGLPDEGATAPYLAELGDLPHDVVRTPLATQDIPAYFAAARATPHEFLCFLNSFAEPRDPAWLAKLHRHAVRPSVGLVGATGSWESYYSALRATHRPAAVLLREMAGFALRGRPRPSIRAHLRGRRELREARAAFAPFPNPHVRTSTFMLRRERMLRVVAGPIRTKLDALRFESGRDGLTRQILAMRLETLVVGRDGQGYAPEQWPGSHTFRMRNQENLLVADNRTAQYDEADAPMRARLRGLAWGAE